MDENEKKIVNFIDEIRGQTHELEIPLNISANTLITALKRAYDLNLDENNTTECYMACEYPIAFLKGNRTLADFGIRNGSSIIFRR